MFGMMNKNITVLAMSSKVLAMQTENHDNHMFLIWVLGHIECSGLMISEISGLNIYLLIPQIIWHVSV
jgi:hypothetical protein